MVVLARDDIPSDCRPHEVVVVVLTSDQAEVFAVTINRFVTAKKEEKGVLKKAINPSTRDTQYISDEWRHGIEFLESGKNRAGLGIKRASGFHEEFEMVPSAHQSRLPTSLHRAIHNGCKHYHLIAECFTVLAGSLGAHQTTCY